MANLILINHFKKSAFSMIEIAVVILIIGILISGISRGIDLYGEHRITSAKNLTKNSRVGRIEDLEIWLETTSEDSFATGTSSYTNLSNAPAEGTKIGMWRDINPRVISSNRLNIFRNIASDNQPVYNKSGINGIPALKFDNNDSFNTYSHIPRLNSPRFTTFLVMNHNNLGASDYNFVLYSRPTSIRGYSLLVQKLSGIQSLNYMVGSDIWWQGSAAVVRSSEIPIIVSFVFDGVTSRLFRNGVEYPTNFSSNYLQNIDAQTYLAPRGFIGEFIYYSRNLSDNERLDVERYLSKKWSIN